MGLCVGVRANRRRVVVVREEFWTGRDDFTVVRPRNPSLWGNRKKQWQSRAYRVIAVQGLPCTSEPDLYHQIFSILDTTYLVSSVYHG